MSHKDYNAFKENSKTDPNMCKKVSVSGKQPFTNIDTYYLTERATEDFGFFGKGWGLKETNYKELQFGETTMLVLNAIFFFPDGEFPISNSVKLAYMTSKGYLKIDEDAWKKIETNTIAKALSRIGYGADVYMGKFEDQMYVGDMLTEHEKLSPAQLQEITKGLTYYKVDATKLTKHFIVSRLADIPASKLEEAKAVIKMFTEAKDEPGTN